jgi:hypothetical protein
MFAGIRSIGRNINDIDIIAAAFKGNPACRYFGASETPFASATKSANIGT